MTLLKTTQRRRHEARVDGIAHAEVSQAPAAWGQWTLPQSEADLSHAGTVPAGGRALVQRHPRNHLVSPALPACRTASTVRHTTHQPQENFHDLTQTQPRRERAGVCSDRRRSSCLRREQHHEHNQGRGRRPRQGRHTARSTSPPAAWARSWSTRPDGRCTCSRPTPARSASATGHVPPRGRRC